MLSVRFVCFSVFLSILVAPFVNGAEFNPPTQIGSEIENIEDAVLTMDKAGNAVVAFVADNTIYFAVGQDGFSYVKTITQSEDPDIMWDMVSMNTNSTGTTYLAFREKNGKGGEKILWTSNPGGQFGDFETVYESSSETIFRPTVNVVTGQGIFVGWSVEDLEGGGGTTFIYNNEAGTTQSFPGTESSFDSDRDGVIHTAYVRDGDIFYSNNADGDFNVNEVRITDTENRVYKPQIVADTFGHCLIMYWEDDYDGTSLYLTNDKGEKTCLVTDKPAQCHNASLSFSPGGTFYQLIYEEDGKLLQLSGILGLIGERKTICDLSEDEACAQVVLDGNSIYHHVFVKDGKLFYSNTSSPPEASFTALPESGRYPLTVEFHDTSKGYVMQHFWSFGDGEKSLLTNPIHVYKNVGVYTVQLKVMGTGGASDEIIKEDFITVKPKKNHMIIPDMMIYAGRKQIKIPVRIINEFPILGFQVSAKYDPAIFHLAPDEAFADFKYTKSEILKPEFVGARSNAEEGYFVLGVVFDLLPPIVGKKIQPGTNISVVNIVADVSSNVNHRQKTVIKLENGLGDPPISNTFMNVDGSSTYPELHSSTITLIRPDVQFLGPVFLRGDANNDGKISLADPVFILTYLFAAGEAPYCMDSSDVDDNGSVNLADPIGLLSFLFTFGQDPAVPFPAMGLDPSEDNLPGCGE